MSRLELRPFADEYLGAAARLLAERHRRHRAAEPLLSERYEDPEAALVEVEAVWRKEGAAGAVASRGGRLVGYLVGAPGDDGVWGANEWVEPAGHAVEEAEVVRDLYAAVADRWLEQGRGRHYAVVPATDRELVDAWFRLSFGQQQAMAIREIEPQPWPEGVREAGPRDVEAMVELAPLISEQHDLSPVFAAGPPPDGEAELRAEIEGDLASKETGNLLAEVDGRVVGNFVLVPVERSTGHRSLMRPDGACLLGFAATLPEARGTGAGLALTQASFAWAHWEGYRTMVTDWRVTNLLSSRFWPRRGFRLTFLRMYRSVP